MRSPSLPRQRHCPSTSTKLYYLLTVAHRCEQLARVLSSVHCTVCDHGPWKRLICTELYTALSRCELIEPTTYWSQVQRSTAAPQRCDLLSRPKQSPATSDSQGLEVWGCSVGWERRLSTRRRLNDGVITVYIRGLTALLIGSTNTVSHAYSSSEYSYTNCVNDLVSVSVSVSVLFETH